jgi:hypothetical protein
MILGDLGSLPWVGRLCIPHHTASGPALAGLSHADVHINQYRLEQGQPSNAEHGLSTAHRQHPPLPVLKCACVCLRPAAPAQADVGEPVAILGEGTEHIMAIGVTKLSTADIKSVNKGIGVGGGGGGGGGL